MKFNKLYKLLKEDYTSLEVPKNPMQQMIEFYILNGINPSVSVLDKNYIKDHKDTRIYNDLYTLYNYRIKFLTELKTRLLNDVFEAIVDELEYVVDRGEGSEGAFNILYNGFYNKLPKDIKVFYKNFKDIVGYPHEGNGINIAIKYTPYEVVKYAKYFYTADIDAWSPNYGGLAWGNICDAWFSLYNAKSINDIAVYIDHIYDIQHNTGTIFSKLSSYYNTSNELFRGSKGYDWIYKLLDMKAQATSVYDLLEYSENKRLNSLIKRLIKYYSGETEERYLNLTNKSPDEQKLFIRKNVNHILKIDNPSDELLNEAIFYFNTLTYHNEVYDFIEKFITKFDNRLTEQMILNIVLRYPSAIKFIKDPSEKVQERAILSDIMSLRYIKNPTSKVIELANKWASGSKTKIDLLKDLLDHS